LVRIFSKPTFEVAFYCYFTNSTKNFNNFSELEAELNKCISNLTGGKKYEKNKNFITEELCKIINFKDMCKKAKDIHNKLKIDDNNWISKEEAFSEIFKLVEENPDLPPKE
jgi:hypothetical protein